jgi:protein SPT2
VPINAIPNGYRPAPLDPAIHRLKELRRLEKEKEAAGKAKRKPEKATRTRSSSSRTPRASSSSPSIATRRAVTSEAGQSESKRRSASPVKRLTFSELMNQAQQKTKSLKEGKEPSPPGEHRFISKTKREPKSSVIPRKSPVPVSKRPTSSTFNAKTQTSRNAPPAKVVKPVPKPLARPSAKLEAKLAARRKVRGEWQTSEQEQRYENYHEDYGKEEYSSDDFIVDDDEEEAEEHVGYDRNEIWKIFGRNRQRYEDYDDDLSDMEATGAEILREETRAEKSAKLEEKAEAERERRRIEEKKRRLGKK